MRPLDPLAVGDSLLHLLGSSTKAKDGAEAKSSSPGSEKGHSRRHGRVHFNHQVRVVLVPARSELKMLKADIWWGEEDYFSFR